MIRRTVRFIEVGPEVEVRVEPAALRGHWLGGKDCDGNPAEVPACIPCEKWTFHTKPAAAPPTEEPQ